MIEQWQELKETIIELRDNDGTGTQQEVCKFLANYMDILEKQMNGSENPGKWIPCSERLPEADGQYLITVKYKPEADYEDIYAEHGEWTDGRWDMFCFGHCGEVEDIIAWMPLPEPYEPQERSEKE